MFKEWIKTIKHYFSKANSVLSKDINGKEFPKANRICFKLAFVVLACVIVWQLPKGLSDSFIDYIKDIFAIFVGFFVTVLCFVFDKLDTDSVLNQEDKDKLPAEQRGDAKTELKKKQEHNYTVRFFYTTGLIILYSAAVIFILIPNIFWGEWFNVDVRDYVLISAFGDLSMKSIGLFFLLMLRFLYRIAVILLTIKVFYYTAYCVSSLLQVLINKKKLETWN